MRVLSSQKVWWIALALILIGAGVLRLTGYNFSLPYIDHPDEPVFLLTGREWLGQFNLGNYLNGYPPLYIWLNIVIQVLLRALNIQAIASTIQILRLISIVFNLLTLLLIALTARRAGGALAGIMAGAAWAFAPLVIENGVYATPDPLVYLLVIAPVWLALVALTEPKHAHWCVWSVVAGCLAILAKYYVLTTVLPGLMVAAWIFWKDRRRGSRYLLVQLLVIAVTGVISILGISVVAREGQTARSEGLANFLNVSRMLNNLYYAVVPINVPLFAAAVIGGVVAFAIARRDQRIRAEAVLLCVVILISVPWLASVFSVVSVNNRMKDVLPATTVACVLLGLGLAQIGRVMPRWTRALLVIVPMLLVFAPQVAADDVLDMQRTLPDSRVALRQWTNDNLTPGTVLVGSDNAKTFNPYWGGIEEPHWFDWIENDDIPSKSVDSWRKDHGVSYMLLSPETVSQLQGSPSGQQYLAQMLPLRSFVYAPGTNRGPNVIIYRLWGIQHPTQVKFGDTINLLGYDLDNATVSAGGKVTLTFYWQASSTPADNYSLFVHLVPPGSNNIIAQADGAPASDVRPTLSWTQPDETLISQPFVLNIPADAAPGSDDLQIGLYNYLTGVRLPIGAAAANPDDAFLLTTITLR